MQRLTGRLHLCWGLPWTCRGWRPPAARDVSDRESQISIFMSWLFLKYCADYYIVYCCCCCPTQGKVCPPPPPPPLPTPAWTHMQGSINRGPGLAVWQAGYCSRPGTGDWDTTLHLVLLLHYTVNTAQQHSNWSWSWRKIFLHPSSVLAMYTMNAFTISFNWIFCPVSTIVHTNERQNDYFIEHFTIPPVYKNVASWKVLQRSLPSHPKYLRPL